MAHGPLLRLVRNGLREPLAHFFLAGAVIFALYDLASPAARTTQPNQIVLTKDDLRQLAVFWLAQGRSAPTPEQMRALVEQKVREEILSREAVSLGLDRDDEMIKRRLAQKMDFMAADVATLQEPSEAELRDWFARNASPFARPPRASFRHLYFSFDRGPGARDAAAAALAKVAGEPAVAEVARLADPFMFRDYYGDRTPEQIAKEFGPDFAKALFQLEPGAWRGPVRSGYGWHLVFVDATEPGRMPAFEEIEPDIRSAWLEQKQREIKQTAFEAMRARYTVVVPPIEAVDLANLKLPAAAIAAPSAVLQ